MPVTLNHTIVHATDAIATATFYADILNLPPPRRLGHFTVLQVGETSLDMIQTDQPIDPVILPFSSANPSSTTFLTA